MTAPLKTDLEQRYGFNLRSICWGYREIFAETLQNLLDEGAIGDDRKDVTERVFGMLRKADQSCYDHLLKEFLAALNPRTRWLMDLPGIFGDVVELGRKLSEEKLYYGNQFFFIFGKGGMGSTPTEVRHFVTVSHGLFEISPRIAIAFAQGYRSLLERLTLSEIDQYVVYGRPIYARNQEAGANFYSCKSKASENIIAMLTHECRLEDIDERMRALLRALVGYDVEVNDLSGLDSDELIMHESSFVCMYKWCFVPTRVRRFADVQRNRDWYRLLAVIAAGMLASRSLPRIQGSPDCRHVADLVGPSPIRQNLLIILEYVRVLRNIERQWPGAQRLIDFGLAADLEHMEREAGPERTFIELIMDPDQHPLLNEIVETSVNVYDTAQLITDNLCLMYKELGRQPMAPFSFLPDFHYPAELSTPSPDHLIANLKDEAGEAQSRRDQGDEKNDDAKMRDSGDSDGEEDGDSESDAAAAAAFVYDEWSHTENDYLTNYCLLHETKPSAEGLASIPSDIADCARRVRRVFENLKPDVVTKEKYLEEGDEINTDLLYEYLIDQRREPSPKIRFYQRPIVNRRDLAVSILLDASGSTSAKHGQHRVIDLERQAAMILAEGLHSLGDRFEIGGFTTNGRENCEYLVFKDLDEDWGRDPIGRLQRAHPGCSTRMGVAIRHAGWRLSKVESRQRLIIVVTDGRPTDRDYSPDSRHAQYDVRMACEENDRLGISTFGISTEENSIGDMEVMFPHQRFAILDDMRRLPRILPRLYVRLTV